MSKEYDTKTVKKLIKELKKYIDEHSHITPKESRYIMISLLSALKTAVNQIDMLSDRLDTETRTKMSDIKTQSKAIN